ncbi:MAG: hypothetical protein ABFD86_24380 [Bryobacteraceae bacterium]
MLGGREKKKRPEEPVKILQGQSRYTAGVLAIAILISLTRCSETPFFEK